MKKLAMLICMVCLSVISLSATPSEGQRKDKKTVKELIRSGNYKIIVDRAYPQQGSSVSLTSLYSLEIKNDSVVSYLPFFGRAYSIPYGGGDGLRFKAFMDEYELECDKRKESYNVKLKASTPEDTFRFTIDIFSNGSARINVTMQNRQPISFSGEMDLFAF